MKKEGLFLGIVLILIGSLWLLGNLNIISFSIYDLGIYIRRVLKLWPLILIVVGTNMITDNRFVKGIVYALSALVLLFYLFLSPVSFNLF